MIIYCDDCGGQGFRTEEGLVDINHVLKVARLSMLACEYSHREALDLIEEVLGPVEEQNETPE